MDDSFDALLRRAAHVPTPAASNLGSKLQSGQTLLDGRLRIIRRIGEGGMGIVYEAFDEQRRGSVALKTLNRLDASSVYRLKNEFRSLADVSHPNLVRLHELFTDGGQWFFTMELVEGQRFDQWVRPEDPAREGHRGDLEARLRAALPQLAAAIAAIHAAGKLHRDLKPSNVLVTGEGRVVVLDFGLAVDPELGGVGQTVMDESVSGTPAYMAPEQAAGQAATAASDYYALGVMLFEALTGRLPFEGRVGEMLAAKQRDVAPRANSLSSGAPADLDTLCEELLYREQAKRPSADELRARLGEGSRGEFALAHSGLAPERELLLGRDAELARLRAAYETTVAGQPVVVFVSGESGMGKSALIAHFLDELRTQGHAAVLAGRCYERESVPFKGIDSVVDDLSRFLRKMPATEAAALMPREAYALARIFPVLGRIDAVAQAPKKDIADPQELRQRAFVAFGELLARIRDRRPLVLYIDDVQWLDRDAATFLGYLLGHYEPAAVLLVLSHRSEEPTASPSLTHVYQHVRDNARLQRCEMVLRAISPEAAQELAARLLGAESADRAAEVALEAGGSPFFLGELSRQTLASTRGARVTLDQALRAHVRALESSARRLLEVLAVAGRPLVPDVALDAAGANHEQIDTLHAERLLRGSGSGLSHSIECYHDKIRESVAQALSAERAHAVHANLLAALVTRPDADPEHLSIHAQGAGDREAGARYAVQAAEVASKAMAFEQAALLYGRALELGEQSEDVRREQRTKLGEALAHAGRRAEAAHEYLKAAQGASDDVGFELKRRAVEQLLNSGHIDDGKALLGELLRMVGLSLPSGRKTALVSLGWHRALLKLRGLSLRERRGDVPVMLQRTLDVLYAQRLLSGIEPSSAAPLTTRYVRLALDSGLPGHAASALNFEAFGRSVVGGPGARARTEPLCDRAEVLALASGDPLQVALSSVMRSGVKRNFGDARAAKTYAEQAVKVFRGQSIGIPFEVNMAQHFRLTACNALGDFPRASELKTLIDDTLRRGDLLSAAMLTSSSALARLIQGDATGVQRHLDHARQLWRRPRDYSHPDFHLLHGEVSHALYTGQPKRGFERLQADWSAMERAQVLRRPDRHAQLRAWRGGSALWIARSGGEDAKALRVLARNDARALARIRYPLATAASEVLHAGLALDEGRREYAVTHLRAALVAFEALTVRPSIEAVRRRLGQVLGDDEGAALVAHADAALRAMGAVDLEATTRLLTWGMEATQPT